MPCCDYLIWRKRARCLTLRRASLVLASCALSLDPPDTEVCATPTRRKCTIHDQRQGISRFTSEQRPRP